MAPATAFAKGPTIHAHMSVLLYVMAKRRVRSATDHAKSVAITQDAIKNAKSHARLALKTAIGTAIIVTSSVRCLAPSRATYCPVRNVARHSSPVDINAHRFAVKNVPRRSSVKYAPLKRSKGYALTTLPFRDVNRYNRIIKRGVIDQMTKKFCAWSNARFLELEAELHEHEKTLQENKFQNKAKEPTRTDVSSNLNQPATVLTIEGQRDPQVELLRKLPGLRSRYKPIIKLRANISKFLTQASEGEQPFMRVYRMVENLRRRQGLDTEFRFDSNILQVRTRLLATGLALRCDLAILNDFLNVYQEHSGFGSLTPQWLTRTLKLDFSQNRKDCIEFREESVRRQQRMHEVEARLYFARFAALEKFSSILKADELDRLLAEARTELDMAKETCLRFPSTQIMLSEIEDVQKLLRGSTFYTTFTNEEKRAVYAAMAKEFQGTGHWHYCENGHPFTVGECGMPMQTSRCPQCNAPVGGQSHQPVEGVRRADDLDEQFGRLEM
ncbi:MAG: hypothetical protein M1816_003708 [Peltula sp. TS41687]|nr:MAG: hypothetical protein M1816_003708 [Peltula sp. TS41687]